ncbi:N-terminal binuclear Zn cluster-containing protein [Zopfia rhizophila CBS 207.26]|uniref:N-terminal binuclear Zn cluster-containing protein n=1 Tax=Zopfia rhizophila CBS 207.26 TaxID=1314779 RepID=A0A6A6EUQ5_9PEZI|nr:N-terminal binuclear Zn cluster-containing protein [Zopfia rhizophila CBS 207.26]
MQQKRQIRACNRCRQFKRRCDKMKPNCSNCRRAGVACSLDNSVSTSETDSSENHSACPVEDQSGQLSVADRAQTPGLSIKRAGVGNYGEGANMKASVPIAQRVIKRRDRACLSCSRCHRLKVKCDKQQPCSRCHLSGYDSTCSYTHKIQTTKQKSCPTSPFTLAGEDAEVIVTTWFWRHRGSSHWRALLSRIESLSRLDSPPFAMAIKEHEKENCAGDLVLPGNFPFGSPDAAKYSSLETVHALIRTSQPEYQSYIDHYLDLYQAIHPIVDTRTFSNEVAQFWSNPSAVDVFWLAQFLMVLGLGMYAMNRDPMTSVEFYIAAEACLTKTPFMFRPSIFTLRTLCLMVAAKQVANATCWALDSCWSLMGVVVRLAVMQGLHQESSPPEDMPDMFEDWASRRRLWTTILYFDIQMALITGMPSLLRHDEVFLDNDELRTPEVIGTLDDCWQSSILESFPIVCHVLSRVNCSPNPMSYEEVMEYNLEVRQLMSHLASIEGNDLLRLTLDIFFRRVLLVLHRRHALHPDAPTVFPISYWSSLECSLALLVHHRELTDEPRLPQNLDLIAHFFMLDFFSAALTASIHLLRSDAPLSATMEWLIPPRQTILDTLKSCQDLWVKEKDKNLMHKYRREYSKLHIPKIDFF